MNKLVKIMFVLVVSLVITGCSCTRQTTDEKQNEDNVKISSQGINSYNLDLKIVGINTGREFDTTVSVTAVDSQDYKITYKNKNIGGAAMEGASTGSSNNQITIYVRNNKTYTINEEGKYVVASGSVNYANPAVYLKGLDNIVSKDKGESLKIENLSYTLYNVKFNKNSVNAIIDDTALLDLKATADTNGEVYLDKDNKVYKIVYKLKDITMTAVYSDINKAANITYPAEIQ